MGESHFWMGQTGLINHINDMDGRLLALHIALESRGGSIEEDLLLS